MTADQLVWTASILTLGAGLQAAIGFGLGLFSIPLLVWIGLSLPEAIGATLAAAFAQTSLNCWQHRADLPWPDVCPVLVFRLLSLPVGVLVLTRMDSLDPAGTKQVIGGFLLGALVLQWYARPQPRQELHFGWTALAGSLSGFCAGVVGMGGPPICLWVLAHDWAPQRQRSFLWLSFLLLMPLHVALLMHLYGGPLVASVAVASLLAPVTLTGAWLGGALGGRMGKERLRMAIMGVLLLIALRSVAAPWMA